MIELTELFSPDQPHKRFFLFDSGVRVKIHARMQSLGFGRLQWTMTGAECDAEGHALPYANGYAIHPEAHELVISADAEWTEAERAAKVSEAFSEALEKVARRVEAAVLNERTALAVYNRGSQP